MIKLNHCKIKSILSFRNKWLFLLMLTFGHFQIFAAPPADPTGFSASSGNTELDLTWTNPGGFDEVMIIASASAITHVPSGDGSSYTADANFGSGDEVVALPPEYVVYKGTGTSVTITGLTNGTTYNFKIFARGGDGTEWSAGADASGTPKPLPLSAGDFPQTCIDEGTVSWTNPSTVNTLLIFAKAGSAVTEGTPAALTSTYTANTAFGSGTAYENDAAAFCIYNSTSGATVDISALSANTTYHFLVFNVDGTSYSDSHAFNGSTRTTVANPTGFSDSSGDSEMTLNWTNPSSCYDEILILVKEGSAVNTNPTGDGSTYSTGNSDFDSGTDLGSGGNFVAYKGTGNNTTITGLTNGTTYHYEIFSRKGTTWSSGATTSGAPADMTPPLVTALSPADGSTVSTSLSSLVMTFDEPVNEIDAAASNDNQRIRIFENGMVVSTINRNASQITNAGNQITIDISGLTLNANSDYYVLIGNDVIEDDPGGNAYAGISSTTAWNFSTTGTTVTAPADLNVCENSLARTLGDIVIEEGGVDDFTSGGTLILSLNPASGFVFEPGTGTVVIESISVGNDINSSSLNVSFTSLTLTYGLDASNNSVDRIIIRGLKLSSDGTTASTDLERTGGSAVMVGNAVSDNIIHATINSGAGPATPGAITTSPTPFEACEGENLAAFNVTVGSGTSNLQWYSDPSLSTLIGSATGNTNPSAAQLGLSSTTAGTFTVYVTQTTTCESAGVPITFTVNPRPVVDAGDPSTICSGESIILGGSPLLTTSTTGPYSYVWTGPGNPDDIASPNHTPPDPGITDQIYNYVLVATDGNGCVSAADQQQITVNNTSEDVSITRPTQSTFAITQNPTELEGEPNNGVFSGPGVVLAGDGSYFFDPEIAGTIGSPHTINYFATLTNGCNKSVSRQLTVATNISLLTNLSNEYCSNESISEVLEVPTDLENEIINFVNIWNSVYVPFFGFGLLEPYTSLDPNIQGEGIVKNGTDYRFDPGLVCETCTNNNVGIYLKFASPLNYSPYGTPDFAYTSQNVKVNQVPIVFFTGLNSGLANSNEFCSIDQDYILTGNQENGTWEIGFEGANFQTATFGGANGLRLVNSSSATFNPNDVSNTGSYTIRYSFDPGTTGSAGQICSTPNVQIIQVNPLPAISFDNGLTETTENEEFCYDSPSIRIQGNIPAEPGSVQYSGLGVTYNSMTGEAFFNPKNAIDQYEFNNNIDLVNEVAFPVSFTFQNSDTECSSSVSRIIIVHPQLPAGFNIEGDKTDLCYDANPLNNVELTPNEPNGSFTVTFPNGETELKATNTAYDLNTADLFDEAVAKGHNPLDPASFDITWTVTKDIDAGSKICVNSFTEAFIITPLEKVAMAGITNGDKYCSTDDIINIELSPVGGKLTINASGEIEIDDSNSLFKFNPAVRGPGNYTLRYVIITGNNCESFVEKNITILNSPVASFPVTKYCDDDVIEFNAEPDANAVEYQWDFGDNSNIVFGPSVTHQYATTGAFTATLTVTSAAIDDVICQDVVQQIIDIGLYPISDFSFSNICEGESTQFAATSNISIESYSWNFGDDQSGTSASPNHLYANVGSYDVEMTSSTINGCEDIVIKRVPILPNSANNPANPYNMSSIDGGKGGWADRDGKESLTSIWEFGIPQGSVINSSEPAWVTNLTGTYNPNEEAYVLSPCFDLSSFELPVVSLDYWSDTQRESDGAVLQYSTDGGLSWQTLGSVQNGISTGLNWYNQSGITGAPGGQTLYGWSRAGDTEWTNARHALDAVPLPRDNVRFRIGFGSNGDTELEGFAFKNFTIEERNKIVLMEQFTNQSTPTAADNYGRSFGSNWYEVIKLEYRTDFPEEDARNEANKADNNSRVAYYGITNSPTTLIDGEGESSLISSGWGDLLFSQKTLITSPFSINATTTIDEETLKVNVSVTADAPVEDDNSIVQVVLAEKDASSAQYIYKMIKMLPNAAGTKLNNGNAIVQGESFNINVDIKINEVLDPALTSIIVFVQNEDTRAIYQAEVNELMALPPVVTSFDDEVVNGFGLYPNPANDQVTILFNQNLQNGTLRIYDNFGKLVFNKSIDESSLILSTQDFASGMYHVQVSNDDEVIRKRLIITHKDR